MLWVSELPGARWPPCADVRLRWTRHLAFIYIYGCEVQNAQKMEKCNADVDASFRWLSQLNTVARQIPWGTCKTAPAPNVNFFLCRSRSLVFSSQQSYDSTENAAFHTATTHR